MKKLLLLILLLTGALNGMAQLANYWQQQADNSIHVTLNDTLHALDGNIKITYSNNSPDTLYFIWMHLWPNAYKNDRTAFSDQLLENGRTDFYFSYADQKGYINRLNFTVDGITAIVQDHPQHQDIIKLILPEALPPNRSVIIETPFHEKLPENFSRGGHIGQSYQVTQWFPKPAVYDSEGWHPMPYLDQGEFYSEFGNYDVQITVPKAYVVAATGVLKNTSENDQFKILEYQLENIHDFAWFADKDFEVMEDTLQLPGKIIKVAAYFHTDNKEYWSNSLSYLKDALKTKSEWLGEYPYPVATVVEKPGVEDGGGMEYPTITLISKTTNEVLLDFLINHEVGHNWFYGILASNERKHPWMDEGMNSYYDQRYFQYKYQMASPNILTGSIPFIQKREPADILNSLLETSITIKKDQPIETPSNQFNELNYNLVAYTKTAQWMMLLEDRLGQPMFDQVMRAYYKSFAFKHPYPADFKMIAEKTSGNNLDSIFSLLSKKGSLIPPVKKDVKLMSFFSLKDTDKHRYLFLLPAAGYNHYDKFMIGAAVHNYTLPLSAFRFFVAPLYATGSKEWNGIGRASYIWYPGDRGQRAELGVAAAHFTGDNFVDSTGTTNNQPYTKIAPFARLTFANKNPRSTITKFIQWKTFLITETGLSFSRDTIQNIDIINYPKQKRYINQLQFTLDNSRVLYPYKATLLAEQGKGFVRTSFTGEYFFNYAKNGGMNVRLFAGKFFYTGDRDFVTQYETSRYHLNMTGPKGDEDYTYHNYFLGRNEFEGLPNQQIMIRDGAFKVRTDLLSNKIGKTDDWLTAMNFTSTIPDNVNPLTVLPVKLPLKVFVDIGTYADAWKTNDGSPRFLYDAGIQFSVLNNALNIYIPLFYSKIYKDYFKSTITEKRFVKNISFSIDLTSSAFKKIFPEIPF